MPLRSIDKLLDLGRARDTDVDRGSILRLVTDSLARRWRLFNCRGKLGDWTGETTLDAG